MTLACQGLVVTASHLIAIGEALLIDRGRLTITPDSIPPEAIDLELQRLDSAIDIVRESLETIRRQIPQRNAYNVAEFIDAHLLMLDDEALIEASRELIRAELCSAPWALQLQRNRLIEAFDLMDDPYLRTRRDDVEHIVQHVQDVLTGTPQTGELLDVDLSNRVIVAHDLTPAEAIMLHHRGAVAFITETGSPMSHTAILARSLNIPTVMGIHHAMDILFPGEKLIVDSHTGTVLADIDTATLAHYRQRASALRRHRAQLRQLVNKPSVTRDGHAVQLLANLELPEDVEEVRKSGAVGVGLYRTEFLYLNRQGLPDEEEHFAVYSDLITSLNGIPITIRSLDLGADKQIDRGERNPQTCNPALGLRAIRLCLKEPGLLIPQLRAILRAAALGPVSLMIPMITSVQEVDTVQEIIARIKRDLHREGLAYDPNLPIGVMIEVPAAALTADAIAQRVDFLSIGTNDLIQYTLAIDRVDDAVSYLYDPLHPAVLRLIQMIIEAGARQQIPISMCGEMAGDPRLTRMLLGLGLRIFSMRPDALLEAKKIILSSDLSRLTSEAGMLLNHLDQRDIYEMVESLNNSSRINP